MGGSKKFLHLLRGVQKVLAACEGGSKKFDDKNFQSAPPHQSIYEHSPYKMQNLVYEWVDFSKFGQIWAKIGSNLRKFLEKKKEFCSKFDPKLDRLV